MTYLASLYFVFQNKLLTFRFLVIHIKVKAYYYLKVTCREVKIQLLIVDYALATPTYISTCQLCRPNPQSRTDRNPGQLHMQPTGQNTSTKLLLSYPQQLLNKFKHPKSKTGFIGTRCLDLGKVKQKMTYHLKVPVQKGRYCGNSIL